MPGNARVSELWETMSMKLSSGGVGGIGDKGLGAANAENIYFLNIYEE